MVRIVRKKIRKQSGKFVPEPLQTLKINDTLITKPSDAAEKLCEHFSEISSGRHYPPQFQSIHVAQIVLDLSENSAEPYNVMFSLRELMDALSNSRSSSLGEDNIV